MWRRGGFLISRLPCSSRELRGELDWIGLDWIDRWVWGGISEFRSVVRFQGAFCLFFFFSVLVSGDEHRRFSASLAVYRLFSEV